MSSYCNRIGESLECDHQEKKRHEVVVAAMYGSNRVDAAHADAERTTFRKAEKRYKLYKSPLPVKSRARYKHQYRETDLSDVVDFDSVLRSHQNGEGIPPDIYLLYCATSFSHPVFCFHDRPVESEKVLVAVENSIGDEWVSDVEICRIVGTCFLRKHLMKLT